ncbi:hypothetical protein [Planococcus shenhongbingii]|uniref:Membrane-bound protein LytA n=1 Tax=Planococcus shenhongbingii TaxID=3058398 RepID=A0ABT8NGY9_9BACL|nr:hypothetical protein [Planococcus sp. N017]MDN7246979.1 hypothetical protein [Planococcus sp. N017]
MKFITQTLLFGLLVLSLSGCIERPENEMVQETERADPASGIDLTTQMNGIFEGYANEEKDEVIIEFEGQEKNYPIAEDATGNFDALKEGDAIAFSTKTVKGEELIDTLRKK